MPHKIITYTEKDRPRSNTYEHVYLFLNMNNSEGMCSKTCGGTAEFEGKGVGHEEPGLENDEMARPVKGRLLQRSKQTLLSVEGTGKWKLGSSLQS